MRLSMLEVGAERRRSLESGAAALEGLLLLVVLVVLVTEPIDELPLRSHCSTSASLPSSNLRSQALVLLLQALVLLLQALDIDCMIGSCILHSLLDHALELIFREYCIDQIDNPR